MEGIADSKTDRATISGASSRCPLRLHLWSRAVLLWLFLATPDHPASAAEAPPASTSWVATKDGSLYQANKILHIARLGTELTTRRGAHHLIPKTDVARIWPDSDSKRLSSGQVITTRCRLNRYEAPLIRELTLATQEPIQVQLIEISPGVSIRFRRGKGASEEQCSWADIESLVRPKERPDPCLPLELPSVGDGDEEVTDAAEEDADGRKERDSPRSSVQESSFISSSDVPVRLESDRPIELWEVVPDRARRKIGGGRFMDSLILHPSLVYEINGAGVVGAKFKVEPQRSARIFVQTGRFGPTAGGVALTVLGSVGAAGAAVNLLSAGLATWLQSYSSIRSDFGTWAGAAGLVFAISGIPMSIGIYLIQSNKTRVHVSSTSTGPVGQGVAGLRITSRGLEF